MSGSLFCVELTGFEPVSKQGTYMLSTRLSWPSFSSCGKTQATNHRLICFEFRPCVAARKDYSVYFRTAISYQPTDPAWSDVPFRHLVPE